MTMTDGERKAICKKKLIRLLHTSKELTVTSVSDWRFARRGRLAAMALPLEADGKHWSQWIMVDVLGGVHIHGGRMLWRSCCLGREARKRLRIHLHHDLTGQPENNR